jgi:hypothetical protein
LGANVFLWYSSSGLLLYAALVDLLAEDFLSEEANRTLTKKDRITAFAFVILGGKAGGWFVVFYKQKTDLLLQRLACRLSVPLREPANRWKATCTISSQPPPSTADVLSRRHSVHPPPSLEYPPAKIRFLRQHQNHKTRRWSKAQRLLSTTRGRLPGQITPLVTNPFSFVPLGSLLAVVKKGEYDKLPFGS